MDADKRAKYLEYQRAYYQRRVAKHGVPVNSRRKCTKRPAEKARDYYLRRKSSDYSETVTCSCGAALKRYCLPVHLRRRSHVSVGSLK